MSPEFLETSPVWTFEDYLAKALKKFELTLQS